MLAGVVLAAGGAQPVTACTPGPLDLFGLRLNGSVWYHADGAFGDAGSEDQLSGKPVMDLGQGRVLQVVKLGAVCSSLEEVLLADCLASDVVVLQPKIVTGAEGGQPVALSGSYDAASLVPPSGLLAQVQDKTIREMAAFAVRKGAYVDEDLLASNMTEKRRDRFDPFKGCKIFYPGSPGAEQMRP